MPEITCPRCGSPMQLREARRGRRAGHKFYGCSKYPRCKAIVDAGSIRTEKEGSTVDYLQEQLKQSFSYPVFLKARPRFQDYQVRFYETLAVPFKLCKEIASGCIERKKLEEYNKWRLDYPIGAKTTVSDKTKTIFLIAYKILTRGRITILSPFLEGEFLKYFKQGESNFQDIDYDKYLSLVKPKKDTNFFFDGYGTEKLFYENILNDILGPYYKDFTIPQIHFSSLINFENESEETLKGQRADFLIIKGKSRIIVELNDKGHDSHVQRDENRKRLLTDAGFDVITIDNDEVPSKVGTNIQKLYDALKGQKVSLIKKSEVSNSDNFLLATKLSHQLQIAVVESVLGGFLDPNETGAVFLDANSLSFDDRTLDFIFDKTREDLFQLIVNLGQLYGKNINFDCIKFARYSNDKVGNSIVITYDENLYCNVPKFIIQSISFHRPLIHLGRSIESITLDDAEEGVIQYFLKYIFRHTSLKEGQFEAILRALCGKDTILLLPTGAGKSVAFQLAALLLPGIAVVIDPIISLIEDQIDNLDRQGIDRVVGISSQITDPKLKSKLIEIVGQGEYLFCYVAPERFQTEEFRNTLRSLTTSIPVCLIAIDEAHCVSEWGHNFRTSYLNIGRNTREYCKYRQYIPPILALTGTASNAVLRDVQRELQIESFDAIITPTTFDRRELHYSVFSSHSKEKFTILKSVLQRSIPERFGISEVSFYQLNGDDTKSGIVFCPHVGGEFGVLENARKIVSEVGIQAYFYSGKTPKNWDPKEWQSHKRKASKDFKDNRCPLLVATKSFGMGIDKSNIRYTVHFGLPYSIEAFYQEAGRAGRDGKQAECIIFVSNDDPNRTERILSPNTSLSEVSEIMIDIEDDWDAKDDITRAMYFHVKTFRGINEELKDIDRIITIIENKGSLTKRNVINLVVPNANRENVEKSIHRLLTIGVVHDYTVDYSTNEFHTEISGIDKDGIIELYARYVAGYNRGRVKTEVSKLEIHRDENYKDFIKSACMILIEFVYDTIERGRRRALLEMLKVSEAALKGNQDKIVRGRVLQYLESTYSEEIENIVNGENAGFAELKKLIEGYESENGEIIGGIRSPKDAAEIRGQAARYLESTPDHPGLCFLRALAEIYCTNFDLEAAIQNIKAGINHSFARYNISKDDVFSILIWLLVHIQEKRDAAYHKVVTELLYFVDLYDFAKKIIDDISINKEMLYEPAIYVLKYISKRACEVS